jgi:DNA polymerase IV
MSSVRKIIHLDMDAFYASVEQRDEPALKGKPVAVGGSPQGRGVVAACSYEARKFGIRSAMPMARALRLCPQLEIVRPDFSKYKAVSQQVMAILRSVTPLVEPLSLDEAYLDVTENSLGQPLAMEVAKHLKKRILEETRLTASAGVAPNKFLAKIASGWQKPDGLTVIAPERVEAFLHKLPVEALWGVGPVTAKKLRAIGIAKLVDVRAADEERLRKAVGSFAERLRRLAHGEDPREVKTDRPWKSISCEDTYPEDLVELREMRAEIARLAKRTAGSLRDKGLAARTVTIKVRYSNFATVTRSHTEEPATNEAADLVERALALLERTDAGRRPVRLLGVGAHGLVGAAPATTGPLPLQPPAGL